jgi:hypothetical protein
MAAAGGNSDGDAGGLHGAQGLGSPLADLLRERVQKSPIHVDRHQANREMHGSSLP